jgi:hypothetical protein
MSTMTLDSSAVHPRRGLRWRQVKKDLAEWRRRARSRHDAAFPDIGVPGALSSKPSWIRSILNSGVR